MMSLNNSESRIQNPGAGVIKYFLTAIFLLTLLFPAAAGRAFAADEKACSQRMGEIATLLELWRVDHGAYPTVAEFSSRDFQAYGALGQNPVKYTCPDSEKSYIYAPNPTRSDYTLSCPEPQVHGLPKLIRTSSEEIAGETELTHTDRQAMVDVIRNLHRAYSKKNLKEVLDLIQEPIENSAKLLHERKGIPEDTVADAFRGGIEDIFNAEKFRMKPLNLKNLTYRRRGNLCEVRSFKPVIESERVTIGSGSESFRVNIKLSQFVFRKGDSGWELIKMDMM